MEITPPPVPENPALPRTGRVIARDERGRIIAGSASLNPSGLRPDGTSGKLSIRETIRAYLADNPSEMQKVINHFIEKNPEYMWNMMEVAPPKGTVLMNPDGSALDSTSTAELKEVTRLLNEIHGTTSVPSNGVTPIVVDSKTQPQNI